MRVKWYGHSCFLFTSDDGIRVLTDPCDPDTGYVLKDIEADVVTVSHRHHDHDYVKAVNSRADIIEKEGKTEALGIKFEGIPSYHDDCKGKKRGNNLIFKFVIDDITIVHAGDLGAFDDDLVSAIGYADVLLVPIGGIYTIDAEQARNFANMIKPRIVIPMHYKTPALTFELGELNAFINRAADCSIHRLGATEAVLNKEYLGNNRIIIFSYK